MPARLEFEFDFTQPRTQEVDPDAADRPLRILLMADFSGRENRGLLEHGDALADRPTVPVDVDDLDDVMFRFGPRLVLPIGASESMTVEAARLDDLHPDALYGRLGTFKALRDMRARLLDPATFPAAAAELRRDAGAAPREGPQTRGSEAEPPEEDAALLERLLGRPPSEPPRVRAGAASGAPAAASGLDALIRELIAPHVVPAADPQQAQLVSSVDDATTTEMRRVLHDPAFQQLEAAWRAVQWLVTSLDTGEALSIHMLDVSKRELLEDARAARGELARSGLYRRLVDRGRGTAGGEPWSLLVGDYTFGHTPEDVGLLAALGAVSAQAGGPLLAGADASILGCQGLADAPDPVAWTPDTGGEQRWMELRRSAVAPWIGLALPRVLMRLPYGRRTEPVEAFDFEELPPFRDHARFLWGNPAWACALLIGAAFRDRGWSMEPGDLLELDDLPAYAFEEDGASRLEPCAETLLSERAAEAILGRGIMPLVSYRDRPAVRLMRFQSIADPPAPLAGPWG